MKLPAILCVHNHYGQPGGEDTVFATESALLRNAGHRVHCYEDHNERISSGSVSLACGTIWNSKSHRLLDQFVRTHRPNIAHFHNTFPLISPSAYSAIHYHGIPVVQTLHNYRLLCPSATFRRNGRACEDCLGKAVPIPALRHACYRGSLAATSSVVMMLAVHNTAGTWRRQVDMYIALSEFARNKFIEGGLPPDRIVVKPNFVATDPRRDKQDAGCIGDYALFAGRLTEEKGTCVLRAAWNELRDIPLDIAGQGPDEARAWPQGVNLRGWQSRERLTQLMKGAVCLVVPSVWNEPAMPLVVLEAFACGLPVIASNCGALSESVHHGRTGLLFRPGDPADLARTVRWAFDHPAVLAAMRVEARREYETKYTPERNYAMLMDIYRAAIERARQRLQKAS